MKTTGTVEVHVSMDILEDASGEGGHVEVTLAYDRADPCAVTFVFKQDLDPEPVPWTFARSLLADVLRAEPTEVVGEGDVRLWQRPSGESVAVSVSSPEGQAVYAAPKSRLEYFLKRSNGLVPPGAEADHLDLDALVARLLGGGCE